MSEKIFIGGRIRRLRNAHGLSQTEMSKKIEISTPYLNLIESNERPLSLSVLMKLHEKFEIDIKEFTKDDSPELASQLKRVFDDPINMDTPMTRREISNLVNNFPNAASALVNIFNRYGKLHEQLSMRKFNEGTMGITESPFESVATIFLLNEENLESVETSAIEFRTALFENEDIKTFKPDYTLGNIFPNILAQLVYYADSQLNVRVRFIPANVLGNSARLYDPHKGEILINQKETNIGKQFHLLVELALITNRKLFDEIAESLKVSDLQKIAALRITLAGYFAGAVLMPKTPFSSKQKNSDKRGSKRSTDIAFYFSAGFAALGNASGQLM